MCNPWHRSFLVAVLIGMIFSIAMAAWSEPALSQKRSKLLSTSHTTDAPNNTRGDVSSMIDQGIMRLRPGKALAPDQSMTIGEFAEAAQRLFALRPGPEPVQFSDVPPNSPYYSAVQAIEPYLHRQLLCPGCALGSNLGVTQPILRAQAMVALVSILVDQHKITMLSSEQSSDVLRVAPDQSEITQPLRAYYATAIENDVVPLTAGGRIDAGQELSRGDAATFLHRIQIKHNLPQLRPEAR
jgi:hypothetical protein